MFLMKENLQKISGNEILMSQCFRVVLKSIVGNN